MVECSVGSFIHRDSRTSRIPVYFLKLFCFVLFCFVWWFVVDKIDVRSCVSPTATRQTLVGGTRETFCY